MAWLTLSVRAEASYAEALSEALLAHGALSVDMLDADADTPDEQAIFGEPGEPTSAVWQHNQLNALFESDADAVGILRDSCTGLGISPLPEHHVAQLEENDWVRLTQSQFDPIPISERLWIVPTWHEPTDPQAINIVLDPGLAFGTGSHPTTRLCLRWLDQNIKGGETVLDYGCGSGILAIAAMKLGAGSTVGVDVDAQAVQASRDNAAANRVSADFYLPDDTPAGQYDVVVANILTNPLRALAPLLAAATRPGGQIVLSGILAEQAEDIGRIYAQWFDLAPVVIEDGWACVSGVKKMPAITQCPECGTRFKVTDEQLDAHDGLVRCGRCHEVFDAPSHLMGEASPQLSLPIEPEPLLDEIGELQAAPPPSPAPPPAAEPPSEPATLAQQVRFVDEPAAAAATVAPRRWAALLSALLLSILLLAQAAYFFRIELAARLPGVKPLLLEYCAVLDCTVPLPQRAELLALESSELEADTRRSNLVNLHALIHNRAPYAQDFPSLELTLNDLHDQPVARRVFKPADYLRPGIEQNAGMAANRDLEISLQLDTGDLKPSGYRLYLFYPR